MWSENERQVLKELKKTCLIHMYLQSGSALLNYILHNSLTLPNIALGAVTSVSIFSTHTTSWRIASGVMAICATILAGLSRQLAPGEKAQLHATVTKQYQSLIREINMKLLLEITEEEEKYRFFERIKGEIDRLLSLQPEPALWAVRQLDKKYPEVAHMEDELIRQATHISQRVSAPRMTVRKARSAYQIAASDIDGFQMNDNPIANTTHVIDIRPSVMFASN